MTIAMQKQGQETRLVSEEGGEPRFYVGVDTHSDTHTIAVLDAAGRTLMTATFPATPTGYRKAIKTLGEFGGLSQVSVGVEGTNSYGAGLSRAL